MLPWMGWCGWFCRAASDLGSARVGSVCPGPGKKGLGAILSAFLVRGFIAGSQKDTLTQKCNEKNKVQCTVIMQLFFKILF